MISPVGDELEWALDGEDGGEHVVKVSQSLQYIILCTVQVLLCILYLKIKRTCFQILSRQPKLL
jgi:hypothetical protein